MKWVVALGVVILVYLFMKRGRTKATVPPRVNPSAPAAAADRRLSALKALEGALCLYEEGSYVLKGRLLQVAETGGALMFTVQTLRAQGLSDLPEERLNLEAAWTHLDFSSKLIHAHQTHWRLYFDKGLIQKVTEMGQSGTDIKAIKRVLLEDQMT